MLPVELRCCFLEQRRAMWECDAAFCMWQAKATDRGSLDNILRFQFRDIWSKWNKSVFKEILCSKWLPVQFSSVTQSSGTLPDPMNHSMPGLPVHYQLLEFTQTHVYRVGDAIQPSHPLVPPSPLALSLSQESSPVPQSTHVIVLIRVLILFLIFLWTWLLLSYK